MSRDEADTRDGTRAVMRVPSAATGDESEATSPQLSVAARPRLEIGASSAFSTEFAGPLPPPRMLIEYGQISGAAELVLAMARAEQDHRHAMEREEVALEREELTRLTKSDEGKLSLMKRGQVFGLIICLVAFGAAVAISYVSQSPWAPVGSALLGVFGLGGLVYVFMRGNHPKRQVFRPVPATSRERQRSLEDSDD
jgi:uncharacterized membrane protein